MAPKWPTTEGTDGRRRTRRTKAESPAPNVMQPPGRVRRLVDVDPWATLLEGLTEVPEEDAPAEREGGNR